MSTPAGSDNPFAPPRATLQAEEVLDGEYLPGGRRRPAGNGATWVSEGWRLFLRAPLSWVLVTVVFCGLYIVVSLVPLVGWMVDNVLVPVLLGGLMLGCQRIERGEAFSVSDLFSGFSHRAGPLMLLGVLYLLASVLIFVVVLVVFGATMMPYFLPGLSHATPPAIPDFRLLLLAVLVMLALTIPLYMAIWFAPALVVFHDVKPTAAMRASFSACARNFIPFLVYGVITFVIAIVATIPLGLGWLAFMPVLWASEYAGYRDIYIEAQGPRTGVIDTLKSVSLPEGAEITLRLAGPLPRALAWLSDTLLRVGIMMLMSMLLAWFGRAGQGFFMIGFFTLWELYPILFEALWDGATPGKRMMKIAVVNGDGTPLAWRAAILRNVLRFADMLPFGYAAGLTSMVLDRQFRRLGDLAAGTVVIHRDVPDAPRAARRKASPAPITAAAYAPPIKLTALEQRAILDFAERRPTLSSERAEELAALATPLVAGLDGASAVERLDGVAAALVERR